MIKLLYYIPFMMYGIIHHEHSVQSPVFILLIQVSDKFHDEKGEGIAICISTVDCKQELPFSCESSNYIDGSKFHRGENFVVLALQHPPPFAVVTEMKGCLVNINDVYAGVQVTYEL